MQFAVCTAERKDKTNKSALGSNRVQEERKRRSGVEKENLIGRKPCIRMAANLHLGLAYVTL